MATHVLVHHFDPHSAPVEAWRSYHAYMRQRHIEEHQGEAAPPDETRERLMRQSSPVYETVFRIATLGDVMVGSSRISRRRLDSREPNAHAGRVVCDIGVGKAWRRRGVATALLQDLAEFCNAHACDTISATAQDPSGHALLESLGVEASWVSYTSRLALEEVAHERLERLANAATDSLGLTWEIHIGQVPMERYLAIVPQIEALMTDQPFGDHDMPPYKINLAGIRAAYAQMAERGGAHLMVLLMDGQAIAAMTEASWNTLAPNRAWQAFTGVAQPWRRKGLAKAVKARTLQLLQEHYPDVKLVETRNASVNAPMLAVNNNLGFKTVRHDRMYQVPLAVLEVWLRNRAATH